MQFLFKDLKDPNIFVEMLEAMLQQLLMVRTPGVSDHGKGSSYALLEKGLLVFPLLKCKNT